MARLLSTEARLEETLRHAREEAAGLVTSARDAAAAKEAALATDLEALRAGIETAIAAEQHRQEQELAEAARREARRFDETGPEQIETLARYVVERVIGAEP